MIKTPFPYFGGKSKAADLIWQRFGAADVGNYVEPFLGSAVVYLNRPDSFNGWVTLNDLDGNVSNFWRAIKADPVSVAEAADWPVIEYDLCARHLWLVQTAADRVELLQSDPDWFDARAAGWWAWGACNWIGGGWCDGKGPYKGLGDAGVGVNRKLPHLCDAGVGVNRKLPHLGDAGKGVNRQLPHLGDVGKGVNRQLPHLNAGLGECAARLEWLTSWFKELQDRLRSARVACGDWRRVCSARTMTRNGIAAVLLDPPYSLTAAVYAQDSSTVSGDVRHWCVSNGDNPKLRIALCGHAGEGHEELESRGWIVETWVRAGGYQGADDRERIWFSPACLSGKQGKLF
jgi:hypothetical protein